MKTAFQSKHWGLEDDLLPSKAYIEKLLDKVEKDDLKAELLTEVTCVRDDADEVLQPMWDKDGTLKAMKVTANIDLPANAEQLRRRLAIMGAAWSCVASAHGRRAYLGNYDIHVWTEYANHLLGKFVLGILVGEEGGAVAQADWEIILAFEHEIRRDMVERMLKGVEMAAALRAAWVCPIVKDRYFVTPLQKRSFSGKRSREQMEESFTFRGFRESKGKGKNNAKGKGKGKSKGKEKGNNINGCERFTPGGNRICFAFNNQAEKCAKVSCSFSQVCGVCFKKGKPMWDCSHS